MGITLLGVVFFLCLSRNLDAQTLYPTSAGGVGAVYTMSNGGSMNQIIIHRLNASGQLTMVNAVNTNGTGVNTNNIDVLISQGSLMVYSNYLFAVNPGSNSLSMFMISPSDATQLTLLSVQSVFGWFPVSVTINSMYACVLTGGNITGIRCFTYNSSGLFMVSSFDRNLTSYISQTIPPTGPSLTMSEILFSADNLALIVSMKGLNGTTSGRLLFYLLSSNKTVLSLNATQFMPTGALFTFTMTLVGANGLLVTDPGAGGVFTMNYASSNGVVSNSTFTSVNRSLAGILCWSTYSPNVGNYYVIDGLSAIIVELNLNLSSTSTPVQVIQYYQLPNNTGALETRVVSLAGKDYLYVIGTTAHVIMGYQLNGAGSATANGIVLAQLGDTLGIPKLAGLAAFVQTQSSTSSSFFRSTIIIMICITLTFFSYEQN